MMPRLLLGSLLAIAASSAGLETARAQSRSVTNSTQSARRIAPFRQRIPAPQATPKADLVARPDRDDAIHSSVDRIDDTLVRFSSSDDPPEPREARPAARIGGNLDGRGPSGYYGGTRLHAYHPDIRSGTHTNRNIVDTRGHCNPARHQVLTAPRPVERPTPSRAASPPGTRPAPRTASPGD